MGLFRKNKVVPVPEGVTESWSEQDQAVVVSIPFNAGKGLPSEIADKLSEQVIATIGAVQRGDHFGHSIPEGVTGAKVKIEVNTGATVLGEIPLSTLDILRERLGKSMEITVVTDPAAVEAARVAKEEGAGKPAGAMPELPKYGPNGEKLSIWQAMKLAAEQQAQGAGATAPAAPATPKIAPREDLEPAVFTWNEADSALRADIVLLGADDSDDQTDADLAYLVSSTLASLSAPETLAVVPTGVDSYEIQLTVAVNEEAAGPKTRARLEQGEDQFEGTRVDFVVILEPRAAIEEMLAE